MLPRRKQSDAVPSPCWTKPAPLAAHLCPQAWEAFLEHRDRWLEEDEARRARRLQDGEEGEEEEKDPWLSAAAKFRRLI